jgi:hypothetical protein
MTAWIAASAFGSLGAAGVAALAAFWSRSSAREANAAAKAMVAIERQRRHGELCPRFRLLCSSPGSGIQRLRLRFVLDGPPTLGHLSGFEAVIRDDYFRRAEAHDLAGGPSREDIKRQIWGPYRFCPGIGSDRRAGIADATGRVAPFNADFPVGEIATYELEPSLPPPWSMTTPEQWLRQQGTVIRLALVCHHPDWDSWTLPCEIDTSNLSADRPTVAVRVPAES